MEPTRRRIAKWKILVIAAVVAVAGFLLFALFKPQEPRFAFLSDQTLITEDVLKATDGSNYQGRVSIYHVKGEYKEIQEALQQTLAEEGNWEPLAEWDLHGSYVGSPSRSSRSMTWYPGLGPSASFRNKTEGVYVTAFLIKKVELQDRMVTWDPAEGRKEKGFVSVVVIERASGLLPGLKEAIKKMLGL